MADFNERLIFRMEVDANNFQRELKSAITAATQNLAIRLQVNAKDVRFVGKIDASKVLDLRQIPEAIRAAVESGIGRISLPTRGVGGSGGLGGGGLGGPRGIDPSAPRRIPGGVSAVAPAAQQALEARKQESALVGRTNGLLEVQQQIQRRNAQIALSAAKEVAQAKARADAQAIEQRRIREAATTQAILGDAQRESAARIRGAQELARVQAQNIAQRRIREAAALQATLGENQRQTSLRNQGPADFKKLLKEQVQRIKFIPDDSALAKAIKSIRSRFRFSIPVSFKTAGITAIRRALDVSAIRVAAASFKTLGRAGALAFAGISRAASLSGGAIAGFATGIVNLGRGIRGFANGIRRALSPLTRFIGLVSRSAAVLTGSGLIIGGAAFLPVAGIRAAISAFKTLAEFTDGVSQSVTLFSNELANLKGADRIEFTNRKFQELGATVQDVSARFGLATSDVSKGLFSILSAQVGLDSTSERVEALEASANVAVGGFTDLESAFKGVVAISRTFGTSFKTASDQLFAIQRLGIAPINRLATQLGRVASLAKSAGAGSKDLGAAISTVTAQAVPLETTITGLRGFFGELAKGGSRATRTLLADLKKIKGVGELDLSIDISTLRQAGGLPKFLDSLQKLRQIKPGALEKLFPQKRVIAALLPLLDNLNQFGKDRAQIQKSNNEASAAAEARLNTLAGAFSQLKVSISNTVVAIADQIASLVRLGSRIRDFAAGLNKFVQTFRTISTLDLKKFISSLFSVEGLLAVLERVNRAFFSVIDTALSAAPILFKAFVGLAEGIKRVLTVAIRESIRVVSVELSTVLISISKALTATLPEGGILGGVSNANIFGRAKVNATLAALAGVNGAIEGLQKLSRGAAGAADTLGDAIKGAADSAKAADLEDFIPLEKLRNKVKGLKDAIGNSILTVDGERGRTIEQLGEGLVRTVDATNIRRQVRELQKEVSREIRGLEPVSPDKDFGAKLAESIFDFKSPRIAKSLVGDIKALSATGNEQIALLQREATVRARKLSMILRDAGAKGVVGAPTRQRATIAVVLSRQIEEAQKRVAQLQASLKKLSTQKFPGDDGEQRRRGLQLIGEADLSDAQSKLNQLVAKSQNTLKGLAFPKSLFSAVGRDDLFAGDLVSQFRSVSQEVARLNSQLAAGAKIDTGQLERLQDIQSSLAVRVLRFKPLIKADPTAKVQLEESFSQILEGSKSNVESIASRVFANIPLFGQLRGVPSFNPISDGDRKKVLLSTTQLQSQLKRFASDSARDLGKDSPIAKAFRDLIKQVEGFIGTIDKIKPAFDKATEGPTGNFDRITFSVLDAESAMKKFIEALDRSVVDRARALESALDKALATPQRPGENFAESDPRFIGPQQQIIDTSVKVFNLQPDDKVRVEDALNRGTESQQNMAGKGAR